MNLAKQLIIGCIIGAVAFVVILLIGSAIAVLLWGGY